MSINQFSCTKSVFLLPISHHVFSQRCTRSRLIQSHHYGQNTLYIKCRHADSNKDVKLDQRHQPRSQGFLPFWRKKAGEVAQQKTKHSIGCNWRNIFFFCRVTFPCYKKKEDISLAESYVISHVIRWNVFFCFSKFASCEILGIFQSNTFSKQVYLFRSIDCEIFGIFQSNTFSKQVYLFRSIDCEILGIFQSNTFKASLFISFDWLRNSRYFGVRLTNVKRKIF